MTTYAYDAIGQLTKVTLPGGETIQYAYDAAGNRTQAIDSITGTTTYSSNTQNQITHVGTATYTYDANGNLASVTDTNGTTSYQYDDLNQLVSITAPNGLTTSVTTYDYSPLGFLVSQSVVQYMANGTPVIGQNVAAAHTSYLVDPTGLGNVASSHNAYGTLIAHFNVGLGITGPTAPSATGYYDFDVSGNKVGFTGGDGSYQNQYSYLPFGETTQSAHRRCEPVHVCRSVWHAARQQPVLHAGTQLHAGHGQF